MILEEKGLVREADLKRSAVGKAPYKRPHIFVRCDSCRREWWAIKHSYTASKSYHKNNPEALDLCKSCRTKLDFVVGIRKNDRRVLRPNEVLYGSQALSRQKKTRHTQGYFRTWVDDLTHPRLKGAAGRVYDHILVVEKFLGRYLTLKEMVHHIDGDKTNNELKNLHLCRDATHHQEFTEKWKNSYINCYVPVKLGSIQRQNNFMKTLLIDDLRNIEASRVARTYDDGIAALQEDDWDVLYLDHDFGDPDPHKTGYGVICWLEEHPWKLPGEIVLVTSNPVGRKQMETVIQKLYQRCPACGYDTLVPFDGCRVCRTCAYSSG